MKIKFQIEYKYNPTSKMFEGWVSALLPKHQSYNNEVATCYRGEINGVKILKLVNGAVKIYFSASNEKELNKKIRKSINRYRRQVYSNVRLMEEMKSVKREILIDFPDPVDD